MGTFRKLLTLALLKLKLKYPSSSYSKRKAKYQRNANVDSEHVKRSTKCNGLNVTPYNAEHKAVSLTVSRQNKGPLCTLRQCRKQP